MTNIAPKFIIGDKAYDSDKHDALMQRIGISLIARVHPTQDGRALWRYVRRWHVERFFAWTKWFRRLIIRFEKNISNFCVFFELGAALILIRKFP